jgi:DNA-binding IclR family transcriptional regulator
MSESKDMITAQQILDVLRAAPGGLTTMEVSAKLGVGAYDAGGRLSKLAAYGKIERMKSTVRSGKVKWRSRQDHHDRRDFPDIARLPK